MRNGPGGRGWQGGDKNKIKSKLAHIDYETYIQQFWLGLLEGDGTITVSSPGANHVKVSMIISIKNQRYNVIILLLIQEVLVGTVKIERKAQYVTWIAISKNLIQSLIKVPLRPYAKGSPLSPVPHLLIKKRWGTGRGGGMRYINNLLPIGFAEVFWVSENNSDTYYDKT